MPTDPFVSRDDLSDYLGQDVTSDDKALIAVDAACDTCRVVAEQQFNLLEDDVVTLDGTGTDALLLPESPVSEVTQVVENDTTLTADDDYKLNGNGILLRIPSLVEEGWSNAYYIRTWRPGRQNVVVTYSHGYADNDLPRDVRIVALSLAARIYRQESGIVFESLGQRSVRYAGDAMDLTPGETLILQKYRRAKSA